jgi:carbon-monoxide dehydrogenase medium subunit
MSLKYIEPDTLAEALNAVAQLGDDAKVIAGGTAMVLMMQQKLIAPEALISLGRVPGMDYVRLGDDGLHIGPMTRLRDVARSRQVRELLPALAYACGQVGNVRIQNQATLGGNLAEADYASDPPAVLLALDASLTVARTTGERRISLADFFLGFYTTALEPGELITDIHIPPAPTGARMTYIKYKSRSSEDRPCVGVAAVASFEDGLCTDLRVSVGAACEVPRRLPDAEVSSQGQQLTDELIDAIANAYAARLDTLDDLRGSSWYRKQMVRVHVRRAMAEVRNGHR